MPRWCLLIHQLPPKPLYLRARIRQRLARVGAVALKNSVYVLPHSESSVEDFQWIAEEAVAGGGEAFLCAAEFLGRPSDGEIEERFRRDRAADYEELSTQARELLRQTRHAGAGVPAEGELSSRASRLKKRLGEVSALDFFAAPERAAAEALLRQLETRLHRGAPAQARTGGEGAGRQRFEELAGLTWVTRKGVHVDRIASAWLIRRFIDPTARFRFADSQRPEAAAGEVRFDTAGGEFTHEGDRCTFEVLIEKFQPDTQALRPVAQIIHDIDLKDSKFGRPEVPGIDRLVAGIAMAHREDEERLARGSAVFEDLYEYFRKNKGD